MEMPTIALVTDGWATAMPSTAETTETAGLADSVRYILC